MILGLFFAIFSFGSASTTFSLLPRHDASSSPTSQANPLDYAPDFSNDTFPPYPPFPDGNNFTAESVRGTRLFGWKGCNNNEVNDITQAWNDFHKLASQAGLYKNIDWSAQAAKDIWGHSTDPRKQISDKTKQQIKQIYEAAQQMYDPWFYPPEVDRPGFGWMKLWVQVQCAPGGDDKKLCCASDCNPDSEYVMQAYSDPYEDYSLIVFCGAFFNGPNMRTLDETTNRVKSNRALQNNLDNWENQARVMFHEVTHLFYFMNAPDQSPIVYDARYEIKGRKGKYVKQLAYGPLGVKTLANYEGQVDKGGFYPQRNADSFAWFAMAKWAESQTNIYPKNPPAPDIPPRAPKRSDGTTFTDGVVPGNNSQFPPSDIIGIDTISIGTVTCNDTAALSGVPSDSFSSSSGFVFGQFCSQVGPEQLEWTVDSEGFQKQANAARVKRTSSPNPNALSTFNFNLKWEPVGATKGCAQIMESCVLAFQKLANSTCGSMGKGQNIMTAAGQFDIPYCGTYSYTITGPDVPPPSTPSPSPAKPTQTSQSPPKPSCNLAFSGHSDIDAATQSQFAEQVCNEDAKGHIIKKGDSSTNIHKELYYVAGQNAYVYDIYWEQGCNADVSQTDASNPMNTGYNCTDLFIQDYKDCNNGGAGGMTTIGCVTYEFSIGNVFGQS